MNAIEPEISQKLTYSYIVKTIFFYLFFFLLLYSEPFTLGSMRIGVLWKIAFLAAILFPVIVYTVRREHIEFFALFAILLSIKMLFNMSSFEYFSHTISSVAKNLVFPMLYIFLVMKLNSKQLVYFAKHFSILIVLSFVPYMLGILTSAGEGYDLSDFGATDTFGLLGVFYKVHAAAISLGIALIVLFYFFQKEKNKIMKLIYILLLGLGIYELIGTYVRTGLLMAIVGIFYLWMQEKGSKKYITAVYFVVPAIFLFAYMYATNPVLQMRMKDETLYNKDKALTTRMGSGRLLYAETALKNWYKEGFTAHTIGFGFWLGVDKMKEAIGVSLFAHNGYVQMLQQEGLIGFSLFLLFLYSLLRYILKRKTNEYYTISMALVLAWMAEILVQGDFLFPLVLLIAIFLALMKKSDIQQETNN